MMPTYRYLCIKCSPAHDRLPPDAIGFKAWSSRPYVREVGDTVMVRLISKGGFSLLKCCDTGCSTKELFRK